MNVIPRDRPPPDYQSVPISAITVPEHRLRHLQPGVVAQLAASIASDGLLQPILVGPEQRGRHRLIAGRHRLEAMRQLGRDTIDACIASDLNAAGAEMAEIAENLIRAELSDAERSMHVGRHKQLYEQLHPEARATKAGGPGRKKKSLSRGGTEPAPAFIDSLATQTGRGRSTVAREAQRAANIPSLDQVVGTSLDKGDELDALAQLPAEEQAPIIAAAKTGKKVSAKPLIKRRKRIAKEKALGEKTRAASTKIGSQLYGVIYADPPWRFEPYSRDTGMDRAADNHYPTMSASDIAAMKIPAAADCVLFLWATAPMLKEALSVMAAWGFDYKTHFIWAKPKIGTGFWNRNKHELLLLGVKGNVPAPAQGDQYESLIPANVGDHSEKPPHFAEIIEDMFPTVPRLEMFARGQRLGWDVWGNEA